ncbi:MAG: tetratricopeptide repeat protein [Burkholderiales bacterium]
MKRSFLGCLAATSAITALACALYLPFLGNPLAFDDLPFFSGAKFAYYATTPFGLGLRLLPYFTLAFPQVMWGVFPPLNHAEIHRIIGLGFHVAVSLTIYKLVYDLLLASGTTSRASPLSEAKLNAHVLAFIGAAAFAIHPAAVYAAGYVVQRTTLLATFFSLLSVIYFARGFKRDSHADAITAALFYALTVFSKEHSVLLPAAAVMVTPLVANDRRFAIRHVALYLIACFPAAAIVVVLIRGVIGSAYEPNVQFILAEIHGIPLLETAGGPWLVSAITQTGVFFKYLAYWLLPDTAAMSVDVRIDFVQSWSPGWIALKLAVFLVFGVAGLLLLVRRGRAGLIGFGMLYFWVLFFVELSSVRFQEPLVIYRSYLWAPGIVVALAAMLSGIPRKAALALFVIVSPLLFYQAVDRLRSFSSASALWEDAAAKLPATPIPGGARALHNLARAQVMDEKPDSALATLKRCMSLYPRTFYCNFASGATYVRLERYQEALPYLERALKIVPGSNMSHYHLGIALEKLGRVDEARQAYREASRLGFAGGDYRLELMDSPSTGGERVLYDRFRSVHKPE